MKKDKNIDEIDLQILSLLSQDSRLTYKELGEQVHRTGQAVGARVQRLIDIGIIEKYIIQIHASEQQFIRIFLKAPLSKELEEKIYSNPKIQSFYKTSGHACYIIMSHFIHIELNAFLEDISDVASYTVESVVTKKF
ncbi:Lrp/AsnC family transcriptional regulator [Acinetobacter nectaris]|uniref:Lrp/AsnC family transcriptional regulator n=1 Tax=Acinetobacter nectaris TaxID=1219382 RepID=UPI001F01E6EE|nr:AsnC family transcriptional regulator [Acinetobacter nectaris]MCF8998093.1 AsnC family transcriptional regulator [Acinetobacter nectaris]MCF9026981.1 AsnC family transcriptional regulator [Acinetobacter nectaris]